MPGVCRATDMCTGHDGFPPRPPVTSSPDVFCNGIPVVRQGDTWSPHSRVGDPPHTGIGAQGSSTVFCNGMPLAREGDMIDCGSSIMSGSPDTICGG